MSVSRLSLRGKVATAAATPVTVPPPTVEAWGRELVLPAIACCLRNVEDFPELGRVQAVNPGNRDYFRIILNDKVLMT